MFGLRSLLINSFKNIKCKNIASPNDLRKQSYATRKRFYRKTGILQSDGKYEVTLDQRKLKTPAGKLFVVESEPLALAVASEWDAQKDKIVQSSMHLTSLCNTVIDNPNKLTKYDIVDYLVNYLATDTLLFQTDEDNDLYKMQVERWDPVLQWFNQRFNVEVQKTRGFTAPPASPDTRVALAKHLLSFDEAAVHAICFGVEALKSLVLMLACVDRALTADAAVLLSRLEEEFQLEYWGRVEWAHELSQQELQARVAAALIFVHCVSRAEHTKLKQTSN